MKMQSCRNIPTRCNLAGDGGEGCINPPGCLTQATGTSVTILWTNSQATTLTVTNNSGCPNSTIQIPIEPCCRGVSFTYDNVSVTDLCNLSVNQRPAGLTCTSTSATLNTTYDIVFNNTLTVDRDFTIVDSRNVKFAPKADVIINTNNTMVINNSTLSAGCKQMWEGITISPGAFLRTNISGTNPNTTIRDAEQAMLSDGGGEFDLRLLTNLTQNRRHIVVEPFAGIVTNPNHPGEVVGTYFSCPQGLLPHYPPNTITDWCIEIDNVRDITIGNHHGAPNLYQHAENAINIISNSTVRVFNNVFEHPWITIFGGTPSIETGIDARHGVGLLQIGTPGNPTPGFSGHSNIFSCGDGIFIQDYSESMIERNLILSPWNITNLNTGAGITILEGKGLGPMPSAPIGHIARYNDIYNGWAGILLLQNRGLLIIDSNNIECFNATTSLPRVGIVSLNFNAPYILPSNQPFYTTMDHNDIRNAYTGILSANRWKTSISFNNITINNPGTNLPVNSGIAITNTQANSRVFQNCIIGTSSSDEYQQFGIRSEGSNGSTIECNALEDLGRGINIVGPNGQLYLKRNDMEDCGVGIAMTDNGSAGQQGSNAGGVCISGTSSSIQGISNDNKFIGTTVVGLKTYNDSYGVNTWFFVRNNNALMVPVSVATTGGVFGDMSTLPDYCGINSTNTFIPCNRCDFQPTPEYPDDFNIHYAKLIIQDSISLPIDSLEYRWWMRRGVYYELLNYPSLVKEDTVFSNFMYEYSQTATPRLDTIKFDIEQYASKKQFDETAFTSLKERIENVSTTNLIEANMKSYADYYLELTSGENVEELIEQIRNIAEECLFFGGPSVLEARALVTADSLELLNYDWETGCYGGEGSKTATTEEKENVKISVQSAEFYKLIPTIIEGNMSGRIELAANEKGVLVLLSSQGIKAASYILNEGLNEIVLNNLSSSGMYFYKVYVAGEMKNTDKIIFIK